MKHILILFLLLTPVWNSAQSIAYDWDNIQIGGGGYAIDLQTDFSTTTKYVSNDVGGLFKWNNQKWNSLREKVNPDSSNVYGCDGFALDPNNSNIIFACFGKYACYDGGIYKSIDQGENWTKVYNTPFGSNQDKHWLQSNIIIDPNNSSVIYCGTRVEGVLKSVDGGSNWLPVSSIPFGDVGDNSDCYWTNNAIGIRNIVIDPSTIISGNSANIYVAIYGVGIYSSNNGGSSFNLITGSPLDVNRMGTFAGGIICTTDNGVLKYNGSNWINITPTGATSNLFNGLSIDTQNDNNILCATGTQNFDQEIFRSDNGGASWIKLVNGQNSTLNKNVPWYPTSFFQAAISFVHFDNYDSSKAYFGDWTSIWETNDIWATPVIWEQQNNGYEVTVNLALCTPPSGAPLLTGFADVQGFRHSDITNYPNQRFFNNSECTSIDYQEDNPNQLVAVTAVDWTGNNTKIIISADNGMTFSQINSPAGKVNGKIAISKNDPLNMVYLPAESTPFYTIDGGNTWTNSLGISSSQIINTNSIFQYNNPLLADRTNDNTFYIFDKIAGILYKSTDGGMNFNALNTANPLPSSPWAFSNIQQGFTTSSNNDFWISIGYLGLWHSTDGGLSFTKNTFFNGAKMCALGKEIIPNTPTVYAYGWDTNDQWGIWRSIDNGITWQLINDNSTLIGNEATILAADRATQGQIYVGTNGRGVYYGNEADNLSIDNSITQNQIIIYPNPTRNNIHIKYKGIINSLKLYNSTGQLLIEKYKNCKNLDVKRLNGGLYFLSIETNLSKTTSKIIIE